MSLSWVWQISLSRGWVMEKGRGQEESEAYPVACRTWEPWVHLLQQNFLQRERAGMKPCQLFLWRPSG